MFGKLKWLGLFILVLVVGSGIYFLNEALPIGTGYSAKYVCSQVFLADRDPKIVFENEVKPTHPLFAPVKIKVDRKKKQVTAAAFGFWKSMTAVYREGCGCTLVVDATREQLLNQAENIEPRTVKRNSKLWPLGFTVDMSNLPENVDQVKLNKALDDAFKEPGPDTMRNTQAIVVVLGNKIIAEQYAKGFDKDTPLLGWSMSKSVINAFTGVLVKKKRLDIMVPAPVDAWKAKQIQGVKSPLICCCECPLALSLKKYMVHLKMLPICSMQAPVWQIMQRQSPLHLNRIRIGIIQAGQQILLLKF